MKLSILKLQIRLIILAICIAGCNKTAKTDNSGGNETSNYDIDISAIDYSNIEDLYTQPLSIIQKCVQGKWKWVAQFGGVVGESYPNDTFVIINDDNYICTFDDGNQQKTYYSWEKLSFYDHRKGMKIETWVMWNTVQNKEIWYFELIKNDTLSISFVPSSDTTFWQLSNSFVRIK